MTTTSHWSEVRVCLPALPPGFASCAVGGACNLFVGGTVRPHDRVSRHKASVTGNALHLASLGLVEATVTRFAARLVQ